MCVCVCVCMCVCVCGERERERERDDTKRLRKKGTGCVKESKKETRAMERDNHRDKRSYIET